jgi:hypothetical protein
MTPELVAKALVRLASELCTTLGYNVKITLEAQDRAVNFDIYSQKTQELTMVIAQAERHVRSGRERLQFARGSSS